MDTISTLLHDPTAVEERTLVYVTNQTKAAFRIKSEGRSYLLEPDKPAMVPFSAAALWFGDPRSRDRGGSDNDRTAELLRLKFKYGIHTSEPTEGEFTGLGCGRFPDVAVTDLDMATVPTVISDPEGYALSKGAEVAPEVNVAQVQAQMEALQAQMNRLLEQSPIVVPDSPPLAGVERPDGTVMSDSRGIPETPGAAKKAAAKRGPKRDGT